uniref:PhoD-like phosphatase metallophosphatase domain-containing protein n=1 Tax=Mucochytrium quahogii TaxID=96639 RepID=A0A7S2SNK6_9STRA|mmetsp:Transcript_15833/g.25857  ORF Transcript_15833/g.25857 Transcript_15833/m.25857 type:complete len:444 (+) Transcript_15833:115-1446(+)
MKSACIVLLVGWCMGGAVQDSDLKDVRLDKIGFGSCNRQWLDQSVWERVREYDPDVWITAGDAYYTTKLSREHGKQSLEAIRAAQKTALASKPFREMLAGLRAPMIGTYDDHDRGVNDGGGLPGGFTRKGVFDRDERKDLFLDFLKVAKDDPRRSRDGVYASHTYGSGRQKLKVIVLDVRHGRSPYVIPSVATLFPPAAALIRLFTAMVGLVDVHNGKMMSETQWSWLSQQLDHSVQSDIAINIIVSSVQVFTSNPLVESWGHFPKERNRLVELLQAKDPQGLIVLSGDVHVGEIIALGPGLPPVEFTSSGITHDCSDGGIPKSICKLSWALFPQHQHGPAQESFFPYKNFGTIDVDWKATDSGCPSVTISIRDEKGRVALKRIRDTCNSVLPPKGSFQLPWAFQSRAWRIFWVTSFSVSLLALGILVFRRMRPSKPAKTKNH